MDTAGTLRAGLARMQSFAERFAAGVRSRAGADLSVEEPRTDATDPAALAAESAGGALSARVLWTEHGVDRAACLLWVGAVPRLLGADDARAIAELGEEEIATLDATLRLAVEEGGDGPPPFDWSALERVRAEGLRSVLREIGATEVAERIRVAVHVGESTLAFLLVPAAEGAIAPEATPAEVAGVDAHAIPDAPADAAVRSEPPGAVPAAELRNLDHLLDVRLPLTIRLGSTRMSLEEVLRLAPGSIVELDHGEDEPLDVLANGRVIARGEVVVVDERFGLRITEIGSPEERVRASV